MQTNDFLDAIKKRHGLKSDYALAALLGVKPSGVSNYRHGRSKLGEEEAIRVAEALSIDPAYVLACVEAERSRSDKAREVWEQLADRLKTLGPVALLLLATGPAVGMVSSGARLLRAGRWPEIEKARRDQLAGLGCCCLDCKTDLEFC